MEVLNKRILDLEEEKRQLISNLEEEQEFNEQTQLNLAQLAGEFSSSVSAAEDAAELLGKSEDIAAAVEAGLATLADGIELSIVRASAAQRKLDVSTVPGPEQLRIVELEMELEEKTKSAEAALEECERLSAEVKQLGHEKDELQSMVRPNSFLNFLAVLHFSRLTFLVFIQFEESSKAAESAALLARSKGHAAIAEDEVQRKRLLDLESEKVALEKRLSDTEEEQKQVLFHFKKSMSSSNVCEVDSLIVRCSHVLKNWKKKTRS